MTQRTWTKIKIDELGNTSLDSLVMTEPEKVPVIVQKSALQNKLVNLGNKKRSLLVSINDINDQERDINLQIQEMDEFFTANNNLR